MKYKVILNNASWIVILFIMTLSSLFVRYIFFTEKFFVDSTNLLNIEQNGYLGYFEENSFGAAAKFFYYINLFNVNTLFEWSLYLSIIYFFINFFILHDIKEISLLKFFFLLLSVFLWYLFGNGITKEILQENFFLMIYFICIKDNKINNNLLKIFAGVIFLIISAFCFREYYILIAFFSLIVYFNLTYFNTKNIVFFFPLACLISLCSFLYIVQFIFPEQYEMIINLRDGRYSYLMDHTDSFIGNIFTNANMSLSIYLINYILNFIRLLIPIELVIIGKFYYFPYIIYQLLFSYYYFRALNNLKILNNNQILSFVFITSFLIVSAMMEPDFGSWIRHQCACWMLVKELIS